MGIKRSVVANPDERDNQDRDLKGIKFAHGRAKNKKILKSEIEALNETLKPTKEYNKYVKERLELCEIHAKKDKHGKPVVESGQLIMRDQKAFDKEHDELTKKHQKAVEDRNQQDKEYRELIEDTVTATNNINKKCSGRHYRTADRNS